MYWGYLCAPKQSMASEQKSEPGSETVAIHVVVMSHSPSGSRALLLACYVLSQAAGLTEVVQEAWPDSAYTSWRLRA